MINCTRYVGRFGLAKKHRRHCRRRYKYWSVPYMSAIVSKGTIETPFRIHCKCAGFVVTLLDKLYSPAYSLSRENIVRGINPKQHQVTGHAICVAASGNKAVNI